MKRKIKNNLVLIVILGISLVITITLLIWTAMDYIQMARYINQTEQLRAEIAQLIKKVPAPVQGNVPLIEQDAKLYEKTGSSLRRHFGHPFKPALDVFFKTLRTSDNKPVKASEFRQTLHEKWNKETLIAQKNSNYKEFQRGFSNWPTALREFRTAAQKITTEPITEHTIDDILLSALGIPRQFENKPENLQRFMVSYRQRLLDITRDKVLFDTPDAMNFSFNIANALNYVPKEGEEYSAETVFPWIARHWEILGDIVKRATDAGVHSFISFRKRPELPQPPEQSGSFYIFHYSIELTGTMKSIREFTEKLDQAAAENRIYVVRSIFLYQLPNEDGRIDAEELLAPTPFVLPDATTNQPSTVPTRPGRRRGAQQREVPQEDAAKLAAEQLAAELKAQAEAEKALEYQLRTGYGRILIGQNRYFRAIIDVEYIMESDNGIQ